MEAIRQNTVLHNIPHKFFCGSVSANVANALLRVFFNRLLSLGLLHRGMTCPHSLYHSQS